MENAVTVVDRFLACLEPPGKTLCDKCVTAVVRLSVSQHANNASKALVRNGRIIRGDGNCTRCGFPRQCSNLSGATGGMLARAQVEKGAEPTRRRSPVKWSSWMWEGNVQERASRALQDAGWEVVECADTASRKSGKDLVARRGNREIWITVKGYPEGTEKTPPATQARHWFAHAVFDLVLYRSQRPDVELALCVPDVGVTYRSLFGRSAWVFKSLPASVIWIREDNNKLEIEPDGRRE